MLDDTGLSLSIKKFWKHVKSFSKITRIPESDLYGNCFRNNPANQADIYDKLFF